MTDLNPTRIEYRRDGYLIWADEDGVHIKTSSRGFEMPEAIAMTELYQAVLAHFRAGEPFPKPTVPDRGQRVFYPERYVVERAKRAVVTAIDDEFRTDETPF